MITYNQRQIASMLFKEAQQEYSNLKAIFDLSTNQLTLGYCSQLFKQAQLPRGY
jgi:hypothetical protein